jgi:hypothetical protein
VDHDSELEAIRAAPRISSMDVDVDGSPDSNVGVRVRTEELPTRPGPGTEGVDVVEDVTGGVVVAGAGVAFGEPGLVEADLAATPYPKLY